MVIFVATEFAWLYVISLDGHYYSQGRVMKKSSIGAVFYLVQVRLSQPL